MPLKIRTVTFGSQHEVCIPSMEHLCHLVRKNKGLTRPMGNLQMVIWLFGCLVVCVNRTGVIHVPYICTLYVHT